MNADELREKTANVFYNKIVSGSGMDALDAAIATVVEACAEVGRDAALWASGDTDAANEVKNLILTLSPKAE